MKSCACNAAQRALVVAVNRLHYAACVMAVSRNQRSNVQSARVPVSGMLVTHMHACIAASAGFCSWAQWGYGICAVSCCITGCQILSDGKG